MLQALKNSFSHMVKDPVNVSFKGEDDDEKVLYLLRRHVVVNIPWVLLSLIMLLVPFVLPPILAFSGLDLIKILPPSYLVVVTFFWYLVTLTYLFENYLLWYSNAYIVTNKRVVDVDFFSLLNYRVSETSIQNIEDITYSIQGLIQTIFNFGSVSVQTAAEFQDIVFEFIPNPALVQNALSDLITGVKGGE